jgi:hypothetical protein
LGGNREQAIFKGNDKFLKKIARTVRKNKRVESTRLGEHVEWKDSMGR